MTTSDHDGKFELAQVQGQAGRGPSESALAEVIAKFDGPSAESPAAPRVSEDEAKRRWLASRDLQ